MVEHQCLYSVICPLDQGTEKNITKTSFTQLDDIGFTSILAYGFFLSFEFVTRHTLIVTYVQSVGITVFLVQCILSLYKDIYVVYLKYKQFNEFKHFTKYLKIIQYSRSY